MSRMRLSEMSSAYTSVVNSLDAGGNGFTSISQELLQAPDEYNVTYAMVGRSEQESEYGIQNALGIDETAHETTFCGDHRNTALQVCKVKGNNLLCVLVYCLCNIQSEDPSSGERTLQDHR